MTVIYTPEQMNAKLMFLHTGEIQALVPAMEKGCLLAEGKAKENCTPGKSPYWRAPYSDDNDPNREPPHMRDTIEGKVVEVTPALVRGQVGTPKHYAAAVHEGHTIRSGGATATAIAKYGGGRVGMVQARPFITDAIAEEHDEILDILAEATRTHIRSQCV